MIFGTDARLPLTSNHHFAPTSSTLQNTASSILYDLDALDAADARAWHSSRLARVAVPASDALQRYWEVARDPQRSGELYGTAEKLFANEVELNDSLDTYQTFSPCPVDIFDSVKAVLIRREYEAAWRDLESSFVAGRTIFDPAEVATRYEGHPTPTPVAPYPRAYTITGCPGIGKTLFLAFALLRCLERHWTVVLQTHPSFLHIFNSVGVWTVHTRDVDLFGLHCAVPKATWCLMDSNEGALLSVPQHIIDLCRFIVQAALPEHRRTSWQDKVQMIVSDYVMRPMGVEEAQAASSLHRADVGRTTRVDRIIREFFDKYGPDTRLAFRAAAQREDWEDEPARRLDRALTNVSTPNAFEELVGPARLEQLIRLARDLRLGTRLVRTDPKFLRTGARILSTDVRLFRLARRSRMGDDVAYALLVVRPGKTRSRARVDFVSPYVRGRCLEAFPGLDLSDIEGA
ncbi:hypothetical protein K525DRAFT_284683 [Schizophyllum commune Loenen D]|nr:hypothetical protein K525DRAFT_284683 [Schizophyllum commune Loenen D]